MLRLNTKVVVKRTEGVIVGRAFCDPPRYDIRTRSGVLFNQPAQDVRETEEGT